MEKVAIVLVNYKDYAKKYLKKCIASIEKQSYKNIDLIIVDNASTSASYDFIKKEASDAKIIKNISNDGFAKGNNDAMRYLIDNNYDYIYLLNMDAYLDKLAIERALDIIKQDEKTAAVQSRLMISGSKNTVNSLGNITHFLGFGYCSEYNKEYKELNKESDDIAYFSGAAVLLKAKVLKEIDLFDEKFWMYNEDQDLAWRMWLYGFKCKIAYSSVAWHDYEFARSVSKMYYMDRNRILTTWKNYSALTLIIFLPTFILMELALIIFSIKGSWFKKKLSVYYFFLNYKNWSYLIKARKKVQKNRKVKDREIIKLFSGRISHQEVDNYILKYIGNPVLNLYFNLSKYLIR